MSSHLPLKLDSNAAVSLVSQLAGQIRWLIVSGSLREGDQLPPVRELGDQLGINLHTVRAAYLSLSEDGLVSVQRGRRARVLRFDRTRDRNAAGNVPSFSIGVIIPEFTPFYEPFLRGVEAAAADQPLMLFICNAHNDRNAGLMYIDRLMAKGVDGIVMAGWLVDHGADLPPVGRPPIVFVDYPGAPGPSVQFNLEDSQRQATSHLMGHGHERIGYLTPPIVFPNVAPKFDGHGAALAAADLDADPGLIVELDDFAITSGEEGAGRLLDLDDPPTAIAASSDTLALGAFHAATTRGIRIPQDIALVGNDGIEMASILRPSLTTVHLPVEDAGTRAVEMLGAIAQGADMATSPVILETRLQLGQSCGCP